MAVNHHLRLALDQVSDAIIIVENTPLVAPGPKILYANEAMAEATGVPVARLCGVPVGLLCHGEVLLQMLVALSVNPAGAVEANAPLQHMQGQATPCCWTAVPVLDSAGHLLNFILTATPDLAA